MEEVKEFFENYCLLEYRANVASYDPTLDTMSYSEKFDAPRAKCWRANGTFYS